jgi:hypothetical protein
MLFYNQESKFKISVQYTLLSIMRWKHNDEK